MYISQILLIDPFRHLNVFTFHCNIDFQFLYILQKNSNILYKLLYRIHFINSCTFILNIVSFISKIKCKV